MWMIWPTLKLWLGLFGLVCYCGTSPGVCAYLDNNVVMDAGTFFVGAHHEDEVSSLDAGVVLPDNVTMRCNDDVLNCFTLWLKNGTDQRTLLKQGCWIHSDNFECKSNVCAASNQNNNVEDLHFCCCIGDFCNRNITDNFIPVPSTPAVTSHSHFYEVDKNYREKTIAVAISPIVIVALVIIIGFTIFRVWVRGRKETPDSIHLMESSTSPTWELDSLKLNTLINGGKYGEVWRGTLNDIDVAVKVFTGNSQKQYYINEKDIYLLPHMDHEALPRFLGAEDRITVDGTAQYLLVMEYVQMGTLTNYLKHNKVDWLTMCKMCRSIAAGVAHLHTEIIKLDKLKPAIAHRDVNTRNILVNPDLKCVLCDFGFAMQINGSNYMKNGNQEVAEHSSLNDVGTIRYMPPEVLEGAVNLRDCEASLKQIDVYATGLIFWEIATRCTDLYQDYKELTGEVEGFLVIFGIGLPVPEYQLPFNAELGPHPSFDDMQLMVSKNKARPLFPDIWKDTIPAIRALKETIEDCWDQDGEARLTALCVEERVLEMETLWSVRYKVGMTPTINTTNFHPTSVPVPEKRPELCNVNLASENEVAPNQTLDITVQQHNAKNLENLPYGEQDGVLGVNVPCRSRYSVSDNSVSTATTDTLLSPLETIKPPPNVQQPPPWNMYCSRPKVLQSHQGNNPIVERNTHKRSDEDLEVQGNTLVNRSLASAAMGLLDSMNTENISSERETRREPIRTAPRIPFMQNDVASEPLIVRPKQPNVQQPGGKGSESKSFLEKLLRGPRLSRLSLKKKEPVNISQKKQHQVTNIQSAGASNLDKNIINSINSQHSNVALQEGRSNITNVNQHCTPTEVYIENGQVVVRPTNGPLNGAETYSMYVDDNSDMTHPKKYISDTSRDEKVVKNDSKQNFHRPEANDDKTQKRLLNSILTQNKAHSHVDLSPTYVSNKATRPSSLVIAQPNIIPGASNTKIQKESQWCGHHMTNNVAHHVSSPDIKNMKDDLEIC